MLALFNKKNLSLAQLFDSIKMQFKFKQTIIFTVDLLLLQEIFKSCILSLLPLFFIFYFFLFFFIFPWLQPQVLPFLRHLLQVRFFFIYLLCTYYITITEYLHYKAYNLQHSTKIDL